VRFHFGARQREKKLSRPVGANGSPSVSTWVMNV
jgi:hypothetical protein